MIFILEPCDQAKTAICKRVTVVDYPDGRPAIRHNGVELAYHTFDKVRQVDQGAIADNKHLGGGIGDDPRRTAAPRAPASQWAAPARPA